MSEKDRYAELFPENRLFSFVKLQKDCSERY